MSNVLKLLKLQIDSKYNFLKSSTKKVIWSIAKYIIALIVVYGVFALLWLGANLIGLALNIQLAAVLLLVTQVATAVFGVTTIMESLYFNKDNELLIVYPVSPNEIFYSKLIYVYFRELLVNTVVVFPMLLSLGISIGMSFWYYVLLIVLMPILPLLPMAVAIVISIPASLVVRFFKKYPLAGAAAVLCVIAGFIAGYTWVISFINGNFNVASQQVQLMFKANAFMANLGMKCFCFTWLAQSLFYPIKFYWIAVYFVMAAAIIIAVSFTVKPFYFNFVLKANEGDAPAKVKKGKYVTRNTFASLFIKEMKTAFRSPNYIFQYFTFTLLMPFIVVCYDKLLLQLVVNSTGKGMISGAHVLILCTLAMLSNISASTSISREGGAFVLLKTNPCSLYVITLAKVCFSAVFTVGGIVITSIICCFYLNVWEVIAGAVAVSLLSIGHICMCVDDDICNPTLGWYDSGEITKLGKNVLKAVISGIIIAFIVGFAMMLSVSLGWVAWLLLIVVSLLFAIWRGAVLTVRIGYRYEGVEI